MRNYVEDAVILFYISMMRTSWQDKKHNENILKESNSHGEQALFGWHLMRREKLGYVETTGKRRGKENQETLC